VYLDRKEKARLKHLEEAARSNLKYIATIDPLVWARIAKYAVNKMAPCYRCGQPQQFCDCRYLCKAESGPVSEVCDIEEPIDDILAKADAIVAADEKNACDPAFASCPACGKLIGHGPRVSRHGKPWHRSCWDEEVKRRDRKRKATLEAKRQRYGTETAN
jgi:hypothetical protein